MVRKSLYDVLLVDRNASLDEIKSAFKRRALQVHPDKGGSKDAFHLVYEAPDSSQDLFFGAIFLWAISCVRKRA